MKKSYLFSVICLLFLVTALPITADLPLIDQKLTKTIDINAEPALSLHEYVEGNLVSLRAVLSDHCGNEFGYVNFYYHTDTKNGRIKTLHIRPEHRKKSFGSILLTFALQTLTECNCTIVTWLASPFNLRAGEDAGKMLPKLLAFYQKHGGIITQQRQCDADITYYPRIS